MDAMNIQRLLEAARGDRPVDLLIRNARWVNVFSGEIMETPIAVAGGYIVGWGEHEAERVLDLDGRYVSPGFIDAHVHIESAMVGPCGFAAAVVPHGTTSVVADPHEIANVLGTEGIAYMVDCGEQSLLNIYFALPSCVPATGMESSGAVLDASALKPWVSHPRIVALAEMMNFPGVIHGDPDVLAKIGQMHAAGKPVDGHSPGLSGAGLHAYLLPGIASDHECTSLAEAREKLDAGMHIMIREGTGARNLDALLPLITARNARRLMWCTDDRHPHDLLGEGGIDSMVRRAVRAGIDPVCAIQMATLNPAEYFRLNAVGAIAPGRRADLLVMENIGDPVVQQVYIGGRLVADGGRMVVDNPGTPVTPPPASMHVALDPLDFAVAARGRRIRVIETVPDQIVTRSSIADARIVNGRALSDPSRDLLKIAVVERHHATGRTGVGFVRGFGLERGALAATVAHDSHNIVAVGVEDADLETAARALVDMGGGLVAVDQGRVIASLPLPIAGLMSDQPAERVCAGLDDLLAAARHLGSRLADPFMTLSFMALPVIPALKITDMGLVDVDQFKQVPLFVEDEL